MAELTDRRSSASEVRVLRHEFGRGRSGYTTLAASPELPAAARSALECFEFGEREILPEDAREPPFLLRPVERWLALTRAFPGPTDRVGRSTLVLRTLLFEREDAAWVVARLARLLRDDAVFDPGAPGSAAGAIPPDAPAPSRGGSELAAALARSQARGATLVAAASAAPVDVLAHVVHAAALAQRALPRIAFRPGSDAVDCDLLCVDASCRRGRALRPQVEFGASAALRPDARRARPALTRAAPVPPRTPDPSYSADSGAAAMPTLSRAVLALMLVLLVVNGAAAFLAYAAHGSARHALAEARAAELRLEQRLAQQAEAADQQLAGGLANVRSSGERDTASVRSEIQQLRSVAALLRSELGAVAQDASAAAAAASGQAAELAAARADVAGLAHEVRANPSGLRIVLAALARAGRATPDNLESAR